MVQKLSTFLTTDQTTKAEIIWAMKSVMSHFSYNSAGNMKELFALMFPDSVIAKGITIGSTKIAYVITHGLAPYFEQNLISSLQNCTEYVVCFDEAHVVQRGQMDLVVRFWDVHSSQVSPRYLTSLFLGHATASDLLVKFREGLQSVTLDYGWTQC